MRSLSSTIFKMWISSQRVIFRGFSPGLGKKRIWRKVLFYNNLCGKKGKGAHFSFHQCLRAVNPNRNLFVELDTEIQGRMAFVAREIRDSKHYGISSNSYIFVGFPFEEVALGIVGG